MKKITALLMALVMVFGLAACGASSPAKELIDLMKTGSFYLDVKMTEGGQSMNVAMAMDGDNFMVRMDGAMAGIPGVGMIRVILKGDSTFILFESDKEYIELPADEFNAKEEFGSMLEALEGDVRKVGDGEEEIDGKKLRYEDYATEDGTERYYIDGDKVYAIKTGFNSYMYINSSTGAIPSGTFDIPSDYSEME